MKYTCFRFSTVTPDFKTKMEKLDEKVKTLKLKPLWIIKAPQSTYEQMYIMYYVNVAEHGKFLWNVRTRDHTNSNTDLFHGK